MDRKVFQEQYNLLGDSEAIHSVIDKITQIAPTDITVLLQGESGVGKDVAARAIHGLSNRKDNNLVIVNCGAIPEGIIESELFGHEKGAFTGAHESRKGYFEMADGGTIFLDEVSCMPLSTQPKLLRAIEEKRFVPVGGTVPVETDARILCATKESLEEEVEAGRFRRDLYYRLNVVEIEVPPLRERREDIKPLVDHFIQKYNSELNASCPGVTDRAMEAMMSYSWPGNVRELANVVERALIFADGKPLSRDDLDFTEDGEEGIATAGDDLKSAIEAFQKQHIEKALRRNDYDKKSTAEELDIGLSSLYRKIKQLDINDGP